MRQTAIRLVATGIALFACGSASAVIGTPDPVPAATLLTPYFEVALDDPNGEQTRLSVVNVYEDPTLAHVQLWTEFGSPSFGFDVYLGGRDSVEIDLRLVFAGIVPQTGPTLSGNGPDSDANTNLPGCSTGASEFFGVSLPIPDKLSAAQTAFLRQMHAGEPVAALNNRCFGLPRSDGIARGYVTIDTVQACTLDNPTTPGYFINGGFGTATNNNRLIGSFTQLDRVNGVYPTSPMVHIEADGVDPRTTTPGLHTFYGTFSDAIPNDNREPLGAVWQARLLAPGAFDAGSEVIVWRDRGNKSGLGNGAVCGTTPLAMPYGQTQVASFDEEENLYILNTPPPPPNPPPPDVLPFPFVTQRVEASDFSNFDAGFTHFNLNTFVTGNPYGTDLQPSFVMVRHRRAGSYSALVPATQIYNVTEMDSATQCKATFEYAPGLFRCENTFLNPFINQ